MAALDTAIADVIRAARQLQSLTGGNVTVDAHGVDQSPFAQAPFLGGMKVDNEGQPSRGHVPGHRDDYVARTVYRNDTIFVQFFRNVPVAEKRLASAAANGAAVDDEYAAAQSVELREQRWLAQQPRNDERSAH